jgi:hypothetical protein
MLDENLIATLEQSLRQTRNAQNRLTARLREVESESERLRQEIEALENSAAQTEAAIYSLLATMRTGQQLWDSDTLSHLGKDYDLPHDLKRATRATGQAAPAAQSAQTAAPPRTNPISYIGSAKSFSQPGSTVEPISSRFADRTITQACTLLLRESGKPLHVNELYNLLLEGGMTFKGNNPTISIAVSLNRNRRFRKVAPGTFDLIIRDAAQAVV